MAAGAPPEEKPTRSWMTVTVGELVARQSRRQTRKNEEDSDGTLILNREALKGSHGRMTLPFARNCGNPVRPLTWTTRCNSRK